MQCCYHCLTPQLGSILMVYYQHRVISLSSAFLLPLQFQISIYGYLSHHFGLLVLLRRWCHPSTRSCRVQCSMHYAVHLFKILFFSIIFSPPLSFIPLSYTQTKNKTQFFNQSTCITNNFKGRKNFQTHTYRNTHMDKYRIT